MLYLLAVALMPGIAAKPQPIKPKRDQLDGESEDENRETCSFAVYGLAVSAWLYLPNRGEGPHPCIVMAHGLGGTKDAGLAQYAERFQEAGFAVLVFDYRHFGKSSGMPRQLLSVPKQLEDGRRQSTMRALGRRSILSGSLSGVPPLAEATWSSQRLKMPASPVYLLNVRRWMVVPMCSNL